MKFTKKSKLTRFIESLINNETFYLGIVIILMSVMPILSILSIESDPQGYHQYDEYEIYEETITIYDGYENISESTSDTYSNNDDDECTGLTTINIATESTKECVSSAVSSDVELFYTEETTITIYSEEYTNYDECVMLNNMDDDVEETIQFDENVIHDISGITTMTNVVTEIDPNILVTSIDDSETVISSTIYEHETEEETSNDNKSFTYLKTFNRGTYYSGQYYSSNPSTVKGGSGRTLVDCSMGDGSDIKGSIASNYIQRNYGYNRNGGRTLVYIECEQYPEMNGTYYLDDSQAYNNEVIDFYYYYNSNCPFQYQGVITVDAWLVD